MQVQEDHPAQAARIIHYSVALALVWTCFVLLSAAWIFYNSYHSVRTVAETEARLSFHKDMVYRRWTSMHGGVYVPVTDTTPPNPYLDVPDRDVVTTDGLHLTLINPAYMTRQVHDLGLDQYGTHGHITSLNPLRPENAPDPWETAALQVFEEENVSEVSSIELIDEQPIMRYMHVLVMEEGCLKCHAAQGYALGDVRGGLSVSVPMQPYWEAERPIMFGVILGHTLLWGIGIAGVFIARRQFLLDIQRQEAFNQSLQESAERYRIFSMTTMDGFYLGDGTGHLLDVNDTYCHMVGYSREELLTMEVADLEFIETEAEVQAHIQRIIASGYDRFETQHRRKDGRIIDVEASTMFMAQTQQVLGFVRDITEQKRAKAALQDSKDFAENIIQTANAIVVSLDTQGNIVVFNNAAEQITGYTRQELADRNWFEVLVPKDRYPEVWEMFQKLTGGELARNFENPILTKRGEERYIVWQNNLIQEGGQITGTISFGLDITDRKLMEDALQRELAINAALASVYMSLIAPNVTLESVTKIVLQQAQYLTTSEHGFVSSIDQETRANVIHTLTNVLQGMPQKLDERLQIVFPIGEAGLYDGLWGEALNTKEVFYTNDPLFHPAATGVPADHIVLERFLSVPVLLGDELVGQIALANPVRDFTDGDCKAVQRLADVYALAVQRVRAGAALRQSEADLQRAQKLAQLGNYTWNIQSDDTRQWWSDTIKVILGLEENEQPSYEAFISRVHPEDRAAVIEEVRRSREGFYPFAAEYRIVRPDGHICYIRDIAEFEYDAAGTAIQMFGTLQDVTEQKQIEAALRESEQRYRAVVEASPTGISVVQNGVYVFTNPAGARMLGYANSRDVIGVSALETVAPEYRAIVQERAARMSVVKEANAMIEIELLRPDGARVFIEATSVPIVYRGESAILRIGHDVSERRRSARLLQVRLRLSEFALTHTLHELMQETLDEIELFSDSTIGFFHFVDELQGELILQVWSTRTLQDLCDAEGEGLHYAVSEAGVWADAIRERRPVIHNDYDSLPYRRGMPDGHAPVTRELIVPIFQDNRIVAVLGVGNKWQEYTDVDLRIVTQLAYMAWDIVQRKQAEEVEREQRALATALAHNAEVINSTLNLDVVIQRILFAVADVVPHDGSNIMLMTEDRSAVRIAQICECYATNELEEPIIGSNWQLKNHPPLRQMIDTREALVIADVTTYDGWVDTGVGIRAYMAAPIVSDGQVIGFLNVDSLTPNFFTEKQAEHLKAFANQAAIAIRNAQMFQQLASYNENLERAVMERTAALMAANEELERLSRAKDEFVSNVSHELRTPIAGMRLHQYLLRKRPDKMDDYLGVIERETHRLEYTIEDLLRLSRLDQGRIEMREVVVDLNELAEQFVLDRDLQAKERGLTLLFEPATNGMTILADSGLLGQVLSILLTNAFNYTPAGGQVTVSTCTRKTEGLVWIGFSVSDTGPGIEPSERSQLFERFYRGQVGLTSQVQGTGLGLAIAHSIVELYKGQITIESSGIPGEGATFIVWLPTTSGDKAGKN